MKRSLSLALLFVLGCATGGVASHIAVPPARAGTTPQRWEYFCVEDPSTAQLNKAGREGWELATSSYQPSDWSKGDVLSCFKRPL